MDKQNQTTVSTIRQVGYKYKTILEFPKSESEMYLLESFDWVNHGMLELTFFYLCFNILFQLMNIKITKRYINLLKIM